MTKKELRKQIKESQKLFLSDKLKTIHESYRICKEICSKPQFKKAAFLFAFMPLQDEVNVGYILAEAFTQGKLVAIPKITNENGEMEFHWIKPEEKMSKGPFDIYEPDPENSAKTLVDMDYVQTSALLLVPGMAFTKEGDRLGRGKGFYDRFLEKYGNKFHKIGICFDFQICETIPVTENDIRVDSVIF